MRVDQFDFDLPEASIALRPAVPRDSARCLVVQDGALLDRHMRDLPELLEPGDLLVFNDTKVIPAALKGVRSRDGGATSRIQMNLHKRIAPDRWLAFARPMRRLLVGDEIVFAPDFSARVLEMHAGGEIKLSFNHSGTALDQAIARYGAMPLPPYIGGKRPVDEQDTQDYQTIFARAEGSVAAPTASLHFTENLMARLQSRGVEHCFVTLHVGAGTFLPVKVDDITQHQMHSEWGSISMQAAQKINAARTAGKRVAAVGTTALRLVESAASETGEISEWSGETDIFIKPGYKFRAIDALITNFHLPRSTLFILVCAFCGFETMQAAYAHAIADNYRFYSYGDGSLLFRAAP